ncbi:MAG TPA: hypothetical protein PLN56_07770 [Methanoregulaceae archaeon]|nr:MAG: hypothetical protein IPI71_00120 [Methanolinea sp.]HON82172.1 hypothetical protein [Methanoregulaceae archaeon]HPD10880.1 hypothetical protein [Methanoregulaceae archaeon]HRT16025.1 hypothetical protein [Methanoregulaceae archaeon]HRU31531.1 hypothetical protein [Methanoregulaceae archaeon]
MPDDLSLPAATYEREFWKQYHALRRMLEHLKSEDALMHRLKVETLIPEQARDMAIKAILGELNDKHRIFLEFFYEFIEFCSHGLHRADISVEFRVFPAGMSEIDTCSLIVDKRRDDLPVEIGRRFIETIPYQEGWEAILSYYRRKETWYDRLFGGNLDRCSLKITEELFPLSCYHITIRLPAQTLLERHQA